MENLFIVGFVFGLKHALDGDHVAAIVSLSTDSRSTLETMKIGLVWGLGHLTTLLLFGGCVLILDIIISEKFTLLLELLVGVTLVLLGADVIRRSLKAGILCYSHQHNGGFNQLHAHSDSRTWKFPYRVFVIGLLHGIAGTAALLLLTLNSVESKIYGLAYILIFGLGSILGMGLLSGIISIPLNKTRNLERIYKNLCIAAGIFTISIGIHLIHVKSQNDLFY